MLVHTDRGMGQKWEGNGWKLEWGIFGVVWVKSARKKNERKVVSMDVIFIGKKGVAVIWKIEYMRFAGF